MEGAGLILFPDLDEQLYSIHENILFYIYMYTLMYIFYTSVSGWDFFFFALFCCVVFLF